MFFHIDLERTLTLEPRFLGPQYEARLVAQLHRAVAGTCTGRYGFVITVVKVHNAEAQKQLAADAAVSALRESGADDPAAEAAAAKSAADSAPVMWGRVADSGSGEVSFKVTYSAIVFRPFKNEVLDGVVTAVAAPGFFAKCGPLTVFVSWHNMPPEFKFDDVAGAQPRFTTTEGEELVTGTEVRLRLLGMKAEAMAIDATGTIKDEFLGIISAQEDDAPVPGA